MIQIGTRAVVTAAMLALLQVALSVFAGGNGHADRDRGHPGWSNTHANHREEARGPRIQLGPRPFYLVDGLPEGALKDKLQRCTDKPMKPTDFSIGPRGAAMQLPEQTKESCEAAARMGAGIIECDITFTADGELVCRHAECDLHTTTNIVATGLNNKCTVPWSGPGSTSSPGRLSAPT